MGSECRGVRGFSSTLQKNILKIMLTASFPSKASIHSFLSSSENACMVTGTPGLPMYQQHKVTAFTSNQKNSCQILFLTTSKAHGPKSQGSFFLLNNWTLLILKIKGIEVIHGVSRRENREEKRKWMQSANYLFEIAHCRSLADSSTCWSYWVLWIVNKLGLALLLDEKWHLLTHLIYNLHL